MPKKPKRPCRYPSCPQLTDGLYCVEHQRQATRHYNHFQREPETNKRYGRAWKRIRDRYIKAHPLCEECKKADRLTPVLICRLNHIRIVTINKLKYLANLQVLHNKIEHKTDILQISPNLVC